MVCVCGGVFALSTCLFHVIKNEKKKKFLPSLFLWDNSDAKQNARYLTINGDHWNSRFSPSHVGMICHVHPDSRNQWKKERMLLLLLLQRVSESPCIQWYSVALPSQKYWGKLVKKKKYWGKAQHIKWYITNFPQYCTQIANNSTIRQNCTKA